MGEKILVLKTVTSTPRCQKMNYFQHQIMYFWKKIFWQATLLKYLGNICCPMPPLKIGIRTDLSFGVGSGPPQDTTTPELGHLCIESVCQDHSQWHTLIRLIRGIAKHQALVTRTDVLLRATDVNTLCYVGRLFLEGKQHVACLPVEPCQSHPHYHIKYRCHMPQGV